MREAVIDGGIFEEFGLDYMGPVDGHNIHDLIQVLETAKHHGGPTIIHVMTKKGKGYSPCEDDSEGHWHGVVHSISKLANHCMKYLVDSVLGGHL